MSSDVKRRSRARPGPRRAHPRPAAEPPDPRPPWWRDPWAWASLLALVPLVLHSLGAPLGEPVADDFDHLHYALFSPHRTWLDGGGSLSFWRPLAYQGYFGLLSNAILASRLTVVVLHVALLAVTVLLLYRTALRYMAAPWAASVGSFPILIESTRALIAAPIHFVDLGLLLFSAIALHEAAASRLRTSMLALLAALLCKESAVATALLVPWMSFFGRRGSGGRSRWFGATAALIVAWGMAYLAVRGQHGLMLPRGLETRWGGLGADWVERSRWAMVGSVRAMFSLPAAGSRWELPLGGAALIMSVAAALRFARVAAARARFAAMAPLVVAGMLWSGAATAPLVAVYPIWSPQRVAFSSIGVGAALAGTLGAAHPALLAVLVALRLALFSMSPGPPTRVTMVPPATGAFVDFEKLVRLQRFMAETRALLQTHHPSLPHGARVGLLHPPIMATYAFGGDKALQIWYRDTTLRWLRYDDFRAHPEWDLAAVVEFQQGGHPQVLLVNPESMRHYLVAGQLVQREAWQAAFDELALADSTQAERGVRAYLGRIAGRRAFCWLGLGRPVEGEREARRGLALWPDGSDARYTLASVMAFTDRRPQARAQLDTLLKLYPNDRSAQALRDSLRAWTAPVR